MKNTLIMCLTFMVLANGGEGREGEEEGRGRGRGRRRGGGLEHLS